MKKSLKLILPAIALLSVSSLASASSDVIPRNLPGGSIASLSLFDIFSPIPQFKKQGWWYLVSTLHDQHQQPHSIEIVLSRFNMLGRTTGLGGLGFTFINSLGQEDYLWNGYPSEEMMPHYSFGNLSYTDANNRNFHVSIEGNPGNTQSPFLYSLRHDPNDSHHVGDIGAQYNVIANGTAQVGMASGHPELVNYQLTLAVQDKRGLVGEGSDGYVGAIDADGNPNTNATNSWEFAMPHMDVLSWQISISPAQAVTKQSPVQQTLTFTAGSGENDIVWLDRQVLYNAAVETPIQSSKEALKALNDTAKPLYHGTWMSFCFNQGGLKNICGDVAAFWDTNTPVNAMNTDLNAHGGFLNIFTPDSNGADFPIQVGSVQTEMLSFKDGQKDLPFTIENDPSSLFTSPLSHHHYAKVIYLSLKEKTPTAALFDQATDQLNNDHTYTLKFTALAPLAENIPGDMNGGFYEGAAQVDLCQNGKQDCTPAGTGFIEQMGYGL